MRSNLHSGAHESGRGLPYSTTLREFRQVVECGSPSKKDTENLSVFVRFAAPEGQNVNSPGCDPPALLSLHRSVRFAGGMLCRFGFTTNRT